MVFLTRLCCKFRKEFVSSEFLKRPIFDEDVKKNMVSPFLTAGVVLHCSDCSLLSEGAGTGVAL